MDIIHKYPLELVDEQVLSLPDGAEVLTIQEQAGIICAWVWVRHAEHSFCSVDKTLRIVGTGHPVSPCSTTRYITTLQVGPMVWHFFEE